MKYELDKITLGSIKITTIADRHDFKSHIKHFTVFLKIYTLNS